MQTWLTRKGRSITPQVKVPGQWPPRAHGTQPRLTSPPARQPVQSTPQTRARRPQPQHAAGSDHMRACERLADLHAPPQGVTPPSGVRALFGGVRAMLGPLPGYSGPLRATPRHSEPL